MKKIVAHVREKVESMYTFEITLLKDFDEDLLDGLYDELEEKANDGYGSADLKYAIEDYLEEELELSKDDYRISTHIDEACYVENELEGLYTVGI